MLKLTKEFLKTLLDRSTEWVQIPTSNSDLKKGFRILFARTFNTNEKNGFNEQSHIERSRGGKGREEEREREEVNEGTGQKPIILLSPPNVGEHKKSDIKTILSLLQNISRSQ